MKIVLLLPDISTRGGVEQVTINLAQLFSGEYGWEVTILSCFSLNGGPAYDIPQNVSYDSLNVAHYPPGIFQRISWYRGLAKPIDAWLAAHPHDIIMAQGGYLSAAITLIGNRQIKQVGCEYVRPASANLAHKLLRRWLYPRLDAFVVNTEIYREQYHWLDNIWVIPNFLTVFPQQRPAMTNKLAMSIGRLVPQKGYDLLLPAWTLVTQRHPDWMLEIIGYGPDRPKLEAMRTELGLESTVTFRDTTMDTDGDLLNASLFLMPSRFEGFPMVLLQAMATGLPCISFDCGGPEAMIDHDLNGILVPPGDIEAFAQQTGDLIADAEKRMRLAREAVIRSGAFSAQRTAGKWKALVESLFA